MSIAAYLRKDQERDRLLYLNRRIGLFAVIQCWSRKLDGVVFEYEHLKRFYLVDAVKKSRIDTFIEDIGHLFPHCKVLANYRFNKKRLDNDMSHPSVWACRMPFDDALPKGRMCTVERLKRMEGQSPAFGLFKMWPEPDSKEFTTMLSDNPLRWHGTNQDEQFLGAYLAGLAVGRISHDSIPQFEKSPVKVKAER